MPAEDPGACPDCRGALTRLGFGPPWCSECEWHLEQLGPDTGLRTPGEKRRRRRSHARAFAQNRKLYAELARAFPAAPGWSRAKMILAAVSAALSVFVVLLAVLAALLLATLNPWPMILGVIVALFALVLRPRLHKPWWNTGELSRTQAPQLFALVDELGAELGAPRIERIVVDEDYNAACARVGLRCRPVLIIGMALWSALGPAGRVALLGHELGHLVNGDPDQMLLMQPALRTFGELASLFDPRAVQKTTFLRGVAWVLLGPAWALCAAAQFRLWRLASTDGVRAEIHADALGVRLGGTAGGIELETSLVLNESVLTALHRTARRDGDPAAWLRAAEAARAVPPQILRRYEQLSIRNEASLFASHPPSGMRLRLLRAWPDQPPAKIIDAARLAVVDDELDAAYRRTRAALQATS